MLMTTTRRPAVANNTRFRAVSDANVAPLRSSALPWSSAWC